MSDVFYDFKVTRVIDGDTFEGTLYVPIVPLKAVLSVNEVRIRVKGADTPERGEKYYKEAKEFTARLVNKKTVKLFVHEKDSFGRLVSDVMIDGETRTLTQLLIDENLAVTWKRGHGNKLQRE
jgi:endonuclease YncB( thermonuclease family)